MCFLTLMFMPVKRRHALMTRMRDSLSQGGALIVFDKMAAGSGYLSTMLYRPTLITKQEAGASAAEIMAKDLSLAGIQQPMTDSELQGFAPVFRFGGFGSCSRRDDRQQSRILQRPDVVVLACANPATTIESCVTGFHSTWWLMHRPPRPRNAAASRAQGHISDMMPSARGRRVLKRRGGLPVAAHRQLAGC